MPGEDTPSHVTEQGAKAHDVSPTRHRYAKMRIPSALGVDQRAWGSQAPQANHRQPQVNAMCSPNAINFYVCQTMNKAGGMTPEVVAE